MTNTPNHAVEAFITAELDGDPKIRALPASRVRHVREDYASHLRSAYRRIREGRDDEYIINMSGISWRQIRELRRMSEANTNTGAGTR